MMTNKSLRSAFDVLNKRFFENRICEDIIVRFGDNEDCEGCDGLHTGAEIVIHEDFKKHGDVALLVLLHEMEHADLHQDGYIGYKNESHHIRFHAGIDRLYKAGAYEGLL